MTEPRHVRKTGKSTSSAQTPKKKPKKKISADLSERFINALGLAANPDNEQVKELITKMNASDRVKNAVYKKMLERYPKLNENISALIARSFGFAEEELLRLVEFLESDIGKKFREKNPQFNEALSHILDNEAMNVMQSVMGMIQDDMNKQLAEVGCDYKYYLPPIKDWRGTKLKS